MRRMIGMVAGTLVAVVMAAGAARAESLTDAALCAAQTAQQQALQTAVPARLLDAISLVESGRWDPGHRADVAWPWTVTAEGQGQFLPTKAEAIALVRRLQARGVTNIDVGCMQVNLQAHPDAFANLDEAFDPVANVAYATRFLIGLHDSTGSWPTAAGYYHSQTPSLASAYRAKLQVAWQALRDGSAGFNLAEVGNQPPIGLLHLVADMQFDPHATAEATAARGAAAYARTEAEKAEAKRIADAYRAARLEEWRLRKLQQSAAARPATLHG